ncbi:MAG: LysM peptidoglycan-binding domain-containing protein [Chloroflexi bacterium]|nr:LysM peptidoglycan-binding domain-containing protein [Chloroflexota bacterium]
MTTDAGLETVAGPEARGVDAGIERGSTVESDPRDATVGQPGPSGAPTRLCPFLATENRAWRAAMPMREHRCTAVAPPVRLSLDKQRRLCLTATHPECATYLAAVARGRADVRTDPPSVAGRRYPSTTPVLLERVRPSLPAVATTSSRGIGQLALVALLAVAVVAIALARLGSSTSSGAIAAPSATATLSVGVAASPSVAPAVVGSVGPSPAPTPSPAASSPAPTPSPRPVATPRPTPSTTPAPTGAATQGPSPSAAVTYVVRPGDTLSSIAARFGTTAAAIQALNGLADPSLIHPGQVLKIR